MVKVKIKKIEKNVVKKTCPECEKFCPVALRLCACGYTFCKVKPTKIKSGLAGPKLGKAGSSTQLEPDSGLDKVGRRFRTKRMRPDYFNSLELEYASKTFRTRKPKPEEEVQKKKRGRPKGSTGIPRKTKEKKDEEAPKPLPELDDMYANFNQEKLQQFSWILDELNFKMSSTAFKPF